MFKGMFAEKEFWVDERGAPGFFGGDDTAEAGKPSRWDPMVRGFPESRQMVLGRTQVLNPCLTGLSSNFPVN